jgi:TldD protein
MISKSIAIKVLNLATATGADFAEIFLEETLTNSLSLENGLVETSTSNISYGAGIRF